LNSARWKLDEKEDSGWILWNISLLRGNAKHFPAFLASRSTIVDAAKREGFYEVRII
jgi:hypothetical protein